MPRTVTHHTRSRGGASGGCRHCGTRGPWEAARLVGCYRLAMRCPTRRRNTNPYNGADCSESCLCNPRPPCPEPKSCEDLLESVAEAQTALAQILNAEGEKLNRIIESTDDFNALVEANRAANRTLDDVICREQALYHELERTLEICGACTPESNDPRAPGESGRQTFPGNKS